MISSDEEILTDRCRLRYPNESDIPHVWSASQTPRFNDGLAWEPPSDIAELEGPLRRCWNTWAEGNAYNWTIESRRSADFIGRIEIRRELNNDEWSLGFWIHPFKQGQGYASESAAAILDFGFARLRARLITAAHATWNHASGKVFERIGMTRVRTNPKGFKKKGAWVKEFEYEARAE